MSVNNDWKWLLRSTTFCQSTYTVCVIESSLYWTISVVKNAHYSRQLSKELHEGYFIVPVTIQFRKELANLGSFVTRFVQLIHFGDEFLLRYVTIVCLNIHHQ